MANAYISAALRAPAHPMAKAGYGKRHAPDQAPPGARDFAHLAPREAAIAAYIDRLPEGSAIGYKILAEELPDYGQQACRSALDRLTREGHLRRIKVHLTGVHGSMHWVTRTYFSRTARNAVWWAEFVRFVRGIDVTGQPPAPAVVGAGAERGAGEAAAPGAASAFGASSASGAGAGAGASGASGVVEGGEVDSVVASMADLMAGRMDAPPPGSPAAAAAAAAAAVAVAGPAAPAVFVAPVEPGTRAPRSEAYDVLAALGGREPRLQLSDAECVALEPLVGEWMARGVGREQTILALVSGLPASVHSAGAFLRKRLETKMPPAQQPGKSAHQAQHEQIVGALMMCLFCDEDETTTTLVDGVCGDCRADIDRDEASGATGDVPDTFLARPRQEQDVAARVAELRAAAGRGTVPVPRRR